MQMLVVEDEPRVRASIARGMTRALAFLALAVPLAAFAGDQKITKAEVPAKVVAALEAKYGSAKQLGWSKEVENGKIEFEAKLDNGLEVTVSAEGKILSEESVLPFEQVPEPVKKAFAAGEYGKWKVRKAEKIVEGEKTSYEIIASQGKAGVEVVFDAQGAVVKEEKTSAKHD